MRRLSTALSALGFLWACAATIYLVAGAGDDAAHVTSVLTAGEVAVGRLPVPLRSTNGPWIVGLLLLVTLLAGIPFGLSLSYPAGHRTATWTAGLVVVGFSLVSGLALGLMYLPVGVVLLASAAVAERLTPVAHARGPETR